jgi:hypothetical protein
MYNLKLTAYAAGAGFILSILAGFIGAVSFGALILRAVISSVLCGVVMSGGYALYKKYLDSDTFEEASDSITELDGKGSHVDIVLDDESLPDEDAAPSFVVNDEDVIKAQPYSTSKPVEDAQNIYSDEQNSEPEVFQAQPVNKVAQSLNTEEVDINTSSTIVPKKVESGRNEPVDEEIQDLPDIESMLGDFSSDSTDSESSDIIEDSDFAVTGKSKPTEKVKVNSSANAKELAAAIRTVIAKDN